MDLSNLKPAEGSVKKEKRIGRGQGSGHGGTSTRGHKGAQSRSGYSKKRGFEGGQMPLQRRVPKFGFKNVNRVEFKAINLDVIQNLADETGNPVITVESLISAGFINKNAKVKILGRGEVKGKLDITAHAFSTSAKEAVEAKGGSVTTI